MFLCRPTSRNLRDTSLWWDSYASMTTSVCYPHKSRSCPSTAMHIKRRKRMVESDRELHAPMVTYDFSGHKRELLPFVPIGRDGGDDDASKPKDCHNDLTFMVSRHSHGA